MVLFNLKVCKREGGAVYKTAVGQAQLRQAGEGD